jgi:hypothetical protein
MYKQALNTARVVSRDPRVQLNVLARLTELVAKPSLNSSPAELSQPVYSAAAAVSGVKDPYRHEKRKNNLAALEVLPRLRLLVEKAKDPLDAALHAAVAGNVIDLGIGQKFDIGRDIVKVMRQKFAISDIARFRKDLRPGRNLLYIGDNAGEIVFDTILVRHLLGAGMNVVFAVKSGPIINDATMEDARQSGMIRLVKVIETGAADIGINWKNVSREFRREFESADVLVAKGHGNFETCDERPENVYFLLKAKCPVVAAELGVRVGDIVFKKKARSED